ncbi:MAG: PAS domain S-box protein, partial [bacterium]|nr:PAS domain S-box protein [bacterium]
RTVIDSLDQAIHLVDAELCICLFGKKFRQWCEQLGLETDAVGKHVQDVFPFLSDAIISQYQQVFKTGKVLTTQEETTFDQRVIITETRKIPVKTGQKVTGVLTIVTDITERKQAEESLRESEERFSKAFQSKTHLMALSTIEEGRFIEVNERFLEVTGYTRDEIIGQTSIALNIFVDPNQRSDIIQAVKKNGHARDFDMIIRLKNGDLRHGLFSAELVSIKGRPSLLTITPDTTVRKPAEEALRESEEKFRATISQSADGILITDGDFRIIEWSDGQTNIFGYTREEMLGRPLWEHLYITLPDEQKSPAMLK